MDVLNEKSCCWAAKNGHLECLKYAHENECPGSESGIIAIVLMNIYYMNESKRNPYFLCVHRNFQSQIMSVTKDTPPAQRREKSRFRSSFLSFFLSFFVPLRVVVPSA